MNPSLRNLLVAGAILTAGGVAYFTPKAGVTQADLLDAGISDDCAVKLVECTAFVDGGAVQEQFRVANCPGRERIIPRPLAIAIREHGIEDLEGQCEVVGGAGAFGAPVQVTSACACRPNDGGVCRQTSDGGMLQRRTTYMPGQWTGVACIPTICHPLFGAPSIAEACQ